MKRFERWLMPSFLVLGTVMAFYPTLFSVFRRMQTDEGDTRFNNYVLEHGFRWITQQPYHQRFWDIPFFYPTPNVASYSDILLGSAPIYWLYRFFALAPETSFQLWMISVSVLNFLAIYAMLRRGFRFARLGSSLGALIFAFGSPRLEMIGHAQMLPHFFTPLTILALIEAFREARAGARRAWIGLFAFGVVAQLYAGFYLGWFLLLGLTAAGVWGLILKAPRAKILSLFRTDIVFILGVAAVAGFVLWPMLSHCLQTARAVGARSLADVRGPNIQSWIYLGGRSWFYFWQEKIRMFQVISDGTAVGEHRIGIGCLSLALVIAGFYRNRREPAIGFIGLCALSIFFVVTPFYRGVWLWPFFFPWFPGAVGIRTLSRIGLFFLIPFAIGIAAFFEDRRRAAGVVLLVLAILFEQGRGLASFDQDAVHARIQAIASRIPARCRVFYYVPAANPTGGLTMVDAIWASLERPAGEIPTINGYSGLAPPHWIDEVSENELADFQGSWLQRWYLYWVRYHHLSLDETCWVE